MIKIFRKILKIVFTLLSVAIVVIVTLLFAYAPEFVFSKVNSVQRDSSIEVSLEVQSFHDSLFIADLHDDSLAWRYDITRHNHEGHSDIPRLREGGVNVQVYSAITKTMMNPGPHNDGSSVITTIQSIFQTQPPSTWFSPLGRALYQAEKLYEFENRSAGTFVVLNSAAQFHDFLSTATTQDKIGAILSVEGLHALEGNVENFDLLYDAGYRIFGMAHFFDNAFAGSAQGLVQNGLTDLGKELITRGDKRGVIWDVAHSSNATIVDLAAQSSSPIIASHTGIKAVCDHDRNLSDEQIRMIANHNGLIGIGFWESALCEVRVGNIVRSARHVADLVGVGHVALGSDFNGSVRTPFDASGLPILTQALLNGGFSENEVRAIMGENVRRVLLNLVQGYR